MINETWTTVAIPTLGESELLVPLVSELVAQNEFDELIVMDNRHPNPHPLLTTPESPVTIEHWPTESIYQMWNLAWSKAKVNGTARGCPSQVVLLNDDIRIPRRFVSRLVTALRSNRFGDDVWCVYPDYNLNLVGDDEADDEPWDYEPGNFDGSLLTPTKGTYKHGGLWGCAFAVRGEILCNPLMPIDTQFKVWCGDDDLVKQIDLNGKLTCRVNGLALEHEASTTWSQHPELHEESWRDVERFKAKYGEDSW